MTSPFVRAYQLRDLTNDLDAVVHFLDVLRNQTSHWATVAALTGDVEYKTSLRPEHFDVATGVVNRAIETLDELRQREGVAS